MFCTVHVQCTHSARYSARHSARPQNAVNTTSFPKNNQKTQKKENISIVFCKLSTKRQSHGIYSVLWPCTVACTVPCTVRALYVHCAKHSLCNSASGGVEAHSLFVGSSCEDERVFGLGLWHVQKGICSSLRLHSHKQKNIVLLCLLGSSFEDESVFGLRLWQVQKVVCSSLCLHIRKPKNLSRTESGKIFWLMDVQIQA